MKTINPSLAQVLRALGVRKFNDVQKAAESHGLFDKDEHYALVSQSRTGKSFTGGVFVANELFKHCKHRITSNEDLEDKELAIFVAPFHASARETSTMLSKYFGWFIRPFLMIGEIHATEAVLRISKGDASPNVIIATPGAMMDFLRVEKTRKWLESRNLVAVVYDDVHSILHDPNRGLSLMELSAFFNQVDPRPRTLVLSAQFDEPSRLESMFNVKLIEDKTKYTSPDINLVKYKTTKEKSTKLANMLQELAEDGIRALVYMKSIDNMKKLLATDGIKLAETVSIDVEAMVRERLQRVGAILKELEYPEASLIGSGIGFYHGQMDKAQRWFVEWAFRRGYLRFLFGTEALAYGVNTPVEEVVMGAPGIDEIFRQSMMARAVRLRRGKGRAGTCTVFTKTIKDVETLERVYYHPKLPLRFATEAHISNLIMGLMGLGLLSNEDDRSKMSDTISMFFKRGSTKRTLKTLMSAEVPLIDEDSGSYRLTDVGRVAFNSTISGYQALRLLEGISILEKGKKTPTDFDLLLLMNYVASLAGRQTAKKELDQKLQDFLEKKTDSILLKHILDTESEPKWKQAIEYTTLIYTSVRDDLDFESPTRKT
ncbi:MAG: DEAD/DEAH box helicase, partial [Candidatus Thorarchaeota archaeon]